MATGETDLKPGALPDGKPLRRFAGTALAPFK
jgi:hypothetical protein